jgi:hypothetical protein
MTSPSTSRSSRSPPTRSTPRSLAGRRHAAGDPRRRGRDGRRGRRARPRRLGAAPLPLPRPHRPPSLPRPLRPRPHPPRLLPLRHPPRLLPRHLLRPPRFRAERTCCGRRRHHVRHPARAPPRSAAGRRPRLHLGDGRRRSHPQGGRPSGRRSGQGCTGCRRSRRCGARGTRTRGVGPPRHDGADVAPAQGSRSAPWHPCSRPLS